MSHTVKLNVKLKNRESLAKAAAVCGAEILGEGTHRLYAGNHSGFAFRLKGWQYPVVVDKEGNTFYDNFGGSWGAQSELTRFQEEYTLAAAQLECENQGWYFEKAPGVLTIFHPSGGHIVIEASGIIDASGFTGASCAEATKQLEEALGVELSREIKTEYNQGVVETNQVE
jgi:hypothetical protein